MTVGRRCLALLLLAEAGSGFDVGRRNVLDTESPKNLRNSLSSYLLSPSKETQPKSSSNQPTQRPLGTIPPLTPPSSLPDNVNITVTRPASLPLTPGSVSSFPASFQSVPVKTPVTSQTAQPVKTCNIPLIHDLFPYHVEQISPLSHLLEIVTPPHNVLQGFVSDHNLHGRTIYIHLLPQAHPANPTTGDLPANFSEVLRPHDPHRLGDDDDRNDDPTNIGALDIRESLTALLDLASENLNGSNLILALDKNDRGNEGLLELLHSLMYVGGQVIQPGLLPGGWDWDPSKWVLVGMEL